MRMSFIIKFSLTCFFLGLFAHAKSQPNSISGLSLWLKSDYGITLNGSAISGWQDASSNNNHCIQNNISFQPSQLSSISQINNQSSVVFDGIDDFMEFSNRITNIRTVFFIIKHANGSGSTLFQPILGDSQSFDFIGDGGTGNKLFDASITSSFILNGSSRVNQIPIVSVASISKPIQYSMLSLTTTGNVAADRITRDRTNTNRVWDGEYSEIIIYNRVLTALEINNVENYLISKYAPTLELGADIEIPATIGCIPSYSVSIQGTPNFKSYLWNNGATTSSIGVSQYGEYSLICTDVFDIKHYDTIYVVPPKLNFNYPPNILCQNTSLKWNTNLPKSDFTFQWQDNSTDSLFTITAPGNYYTTITDKFSCSYTTNTITVTQDNFPTTTSLGADVSLCAGNAIALQTNTTSITTYTWNDGSHQPNLVINTSGQYFVAVTNTNNCIAKDTIQITVLGQAPSVNFNASVGCRNSAVSFTNLALAPVGNTITSVLWNFGNTTSSTNTTNIINPTHIYADTGMYVVSLTVNTDVGCSNNTSQSIHIAPTPTVNFINGISCQNDSTAFASIITSPTYSIISKQWTFGDIASGAANTSTLSNPKHLFSNQTNYTTRLVATNIAGCKDSITKLIAVKAQVKADFNYTSACTGSLMKFTDNSIVPAPNTSNVRQWNFATSTATGTLINQFYSIAAVYPVTLTVIGNNGCVSSAVKQITVTIPPTCNFSTLSSFCVSDSVLLLDASAGSSPIQQWNWIANSNLYSTLPSVYFKNATSGTQIIKLKVTDTKGCKDSLSKSVTIYALPNSNFTITPNDVFANSTITLTPHTATYSTYSWLGSNGFSSSLPTPVYTFADTGKYDFYLQVLDANGCKNTAQQSLQINNKRTDLGVLELMPSLQPTGYLGLTAQLGNLGTAPINQFKLKITLQNSSQIQETWLGNLNKGTLLNYEVTELLTNDASKNGIVCATITEINNEPVDDNLNNNYLCTEISPNGTAIYEPYPNPSADVITFPIAVKNDVSVLIEITNTLGELVIAEQKSTTQGLNFETLSVYGLAKGAYFAKITIDDKIFVKKIMRR